MRRPLALPLLAALAICASALPARAAFPPDGRQLTALPGSQGAYGCVPDGFGGAIVSFSDGQAWAQRVTFNGDIAPGWPADGLPLCVGPGSRSSARAVADATGGAFVVWEDTRNGPPDIFAQHVLGAGIVDPAWPANGLPVASRALNQYTHAVSSDGAGGLLVVWQDDFSGDLDIYAQRVTAAGAALWASNGAPACVFPGFQSNPRIVSDGAGGAFVAWTDERTQYPRVFAQHLTPTGAVAPGWPADGLPLTINFGSNRDPALLADGSGGVFIAWSGSSQLGVSHPIVHHLDANGSPAPGWPATPVQLCSVLQTQDLVQIVTDRMGGAIVAWRDFRDIQNPVINIDIYAQRVSAAGTPLWTANGQPVCTASGVQDSPAAISDDQGGIIVAWQDGRADNDIYALRLLANGQRATGWPLDGLPLCTAAGSQMGPLLCPDGLSGAIVAWTDGRPTMPRTQAPDVYATKTPDDAVVPVLATLAHVDAAPDRVSLEWRLAAAAPGARVERRAEGGEWIALGLVAMEVAGIARFEDTAVSSGAVYEYHLVDADGAEISAAVRVEVPRAALSLEGARPNPAAGDLTAAFTLPDAAPAQLAVLDPAGRVLAEREVGSLGAGRHVVPAAAALPPGLYFLRLTGAGRALTARACVVR